MHYKKALLYKILSKEDSVVQSLKETTLKDVVFSLANSWENLTEKTVVCSWRNLWPDMTLLEQYKKTKNTGNQKGNDQDEENDRELTELRDTIAEKLVDESESLTKEDVHMWLIGEEENGQLMTEDEIIEDVTRREEEEGDGRECAIVLHTVSNYAAMDAFSTSVKWAEENNVSASDILVLKRLQEKVLKVSFQAKQQTKIDSFFTPME
uniref:DDE-1 domain-containing protein n=2 Tax=Graphocephala atropunctata TaxID=36148 RepID=A0A1B6LK79_9HEMI